MDENASTQDMPDRPEGGGGGEDTRSINGLPVIPGYQVMDELGFGGMGVVYRAKHLALDRIVAIKMLRGFSGKSDLARFLREAETSASLNHTHIAQVYEVGALGTAPYFSMEYLEGGTLSSRCGKMTVREIATLMQSLAKAVHYAHGKGVVHRDLKPANVLFSQDGCAKIGDFGIAKRLEEEAHITQTGAVIGTPQYMAPEQASGDSRNVGPAADVYALGVILYELLAGRPPFLSTESATPITIRVIQEEAVSPAFHQSSTPRDLEVICLKCLQKDPKDRYASAGALEEDLRRYLADEPILAHPPTTIVRTVKWARRHPVRSIALVLLGIVMGWSTYALWEWDTYERLRINYFDGVTQQYGRWVGVGPLSAEDIRHRTLSVRMYQHGRKGGVYRIEYVNSRGNIAEDNGGNFATWIDVFGATGTEKSPATVIVDFDLDQHGLPREQTCRDMLDHVTIRTQYEYVYDANGKPRQVTARFLNAQNWELSSVYGASYVELAVDGQGHVTRGMFFDNHHSPAMNNDGVYGISLTPNAGGRLEKFTFLDEHGEPRADFNGIVAVATTGFNPFDRPNHFEYRDSADKPMVLPSGIAGARQEFDQWGNLLGNEFLDKDGKRTLNTSSNIALRTNVLDPNTGQIKEIAYFDVDGKPAEPKGGNLWKTVYAYDALGYVSQRTTFDATEKELLDTRLQHDDRGHVVEKRFFVGDRLFGRVTQEFDGFGNITKVVSYGPADQVVQQELSKYKDGLRLIEVEYLDAQDKPLHQAEGSPLRDTGANRITYEWDWNGLETAQVDHGLLERPYSAERREFDNRGRALRRIHMDADDKRVNNEDGWAEVEYFYDSLSQPLGRRFFDADRHAVANEVFVNEVDAGGPGDKAGLKVDDVLRSYDGQHIGNTYDLAEVRLKDATKPGEIELVVSRDGREVSLKVKAGSLQVSLGDRFVNASSKPATRPSKPRAVAAL